MTGRKRRSPGEGGTYSYRTKAGERWYWKAVLELPDGTRAQKVKRGFVSRREALADMREALSASGKGGYAEPSRQPFGAYLATWLDGDTEVRTLPIPRDTPDWTLGSFWGHPERVLDDRRS